MITKELYDNTKENFLVFETKKQQPVFFPKEESQMFESKSFDYLSPNANVMSDNQDAEAFANRNSPNYIPLNSSHTATDYIGAVNLTVPFNIKDEFVNFKYYNLLTDKLENFYEVTDTVEKIKNLSIGVQRIRIPINIFNKVLNPITDAGEIANGGLDNLIKNFGKYYLFIKPKFIQTFISNVLEKSHVSFSDMPTNNDGANVPIEKRRTIYECAKTDFLASPWNFDTEPNQSGRLFGSVVEIWNSAATELKQIKIMNENVFNFNDPSEMKFVLSPDNFGYDPSEQVGGIGDIIRVYPRETYFNEVVIEIDYKDEYLKLDNMISFMLNDVARDMKTGSYQVYDDKGLKVEETGLITGSVIHRWQISQTDRYELRKRIK